MFEDYLQDAYYFYNQAIKSKNSSNDREAKMFFRASVFCAASSIEAFINFIGDTFSKGGTLDKIEVAFLNDKNLEIPPSTASIEKKIRYYSIDSKLKFIINKFQVNIIPGTSQVWSFFIEFKEFRDSLIHPRTTDDNIDLEDYKNKIKKGLNSNIDIMNEISNKIFKRPLRKSLVDLKL